MSVFTGSVSAALTVSLAIETTWSICFRMFLFPSAQTVSICELPSSAFNVFVGVLTLRIGAPYDVLEECVLRRNQSTSSARHFAAYSLRRVAVFAMTLGRLQLVGGFRTGYGKRLRFRFHLDNRPTMRDCGE